MEVQADLPDGTSLLVEVPDFFKEHEIFDAVDVAVAAHTQEESEEAPPVEEEEDNPFVPQHKEYDKDLKSVNGMPNTGDTARNFLIQYEGNNPKVHDDGAKNETIGIGHLLTPKERESGKIRIGEEDVAYRASGLTQKQMTQLFEDDFDSRWEAAGSLIERGGLSHVPNLQTALASFLFNISSRENPEAGFKKVAPLAYNALLRGDLEAFKFEAFDSKQGVVQAGGEVMTGLVNRRAAERGLLDPNRGSQRFQVADTQSDTGGGFLDTVGDVAGELFGFKSTAAAEIAHTVVSGDTLGKIARDNGTTVSELMEANPQIKDANRINVGDRINLGGVTTAAPVEAPPPEPESQPEPLETKTTSNSLFKPGIRKPHAIPPGNRKPDISVDKPLPESVLSQEENEALANEIAQDMVLGNPEQAAEKLFPFVGDHAWFALRHMKVALKEKMGWEITDEDRRPINEKEVSPEVLDMIMIASFNAHKEKRGTNYGKDYGVAAKLVYRNQRGDIWDILKNVGATFFDPAAAAGLAIGESSDISVDSRGHLVLKNDIHNFPEMPASAGSDAWIIMQKFFADKTGLFGIKDKKNSIPIEFDFGPLEEVRKRVEALQNGEGVTLGKGSNLTGGGAGDDQLRNLRPEEETLVDVFQKAGLSPEVALAIGKPLQVVADFIGLSDIRDAGQFAAEGEFVSARDALIFGLGLKGGKHGLRLITGGKKGAKASPPEDQPTLEVLLGGKKDLSPEEKEIADLIDQNASTDALLDKLFGNAAASKKANSLIPSVNPSPKTATPQTSDALSFQRAALKQRADKGIPNPGDEIQGVFEEGLGRPLHPVFAEFLMKTHDETGIRPVLIGRRVGRGDDVEDLNVIALFQENKLVGEVIINDDQLLIKVGKDFGRVNRGGDDMETALDFIIKGLSPTKATKGSRKFKGSDPLTRREEVDIQGGALSTKLNETQLGKILDDHGIEWTHADNGGITAVEKFSRGPDRKKHFAPNTSLRTIRNWLGY